MHTRALLAFGLFFTQLLALSGAGIPAAPAPLRAASASTPTFSREDGLLVARVYFSDPAELQNLVTQYDATEFVDHQAGFVELLLAPAERDTLLAAGYQVEIDTERTALLNQPRVNLPTQANGIPGYVCYRTVEETYAALARIAIDQPNLATWIDIGDSWDKLTPGGPPGYDLRVLILTNHALPGPKPVFFLMAGIHAREYTTAEQATRYAEYLAGNYGFDPDVTWLLDNFEVHILPQANPDGRKIAESGLAHRKNTHPEPVTCPPFSYSFYHQGVDLNRNSTFQWGGIGSTDDPCMQTYRGTSAASEPETQAIQAYVGALFPDQRGPALSDPAPDDATGVFITLHSYGGLVLYPWGATSIPAPNADDLQTLGRKFGFYNRYKVCQSGPCLYQTSGTTDDWAYGELGVAAYTFELGTYFFQDCATFEEEIVPANQPALLYALKAARRPYQSPAGPETLTVTVSSPIVSPGALVTLTAVADDGRYFSNGYGNEATQPISATRYSLDTPSWVTGTVTFPLLAADGTFDASVEGVTVVIDTTGWTPGRHLLLVESQDNAGNWGVPGAVFVYAIPADWERHFLPLIRK